RLLSEEENLSLELQGAEEEIDSLVSKGYEASNISLVIASDELGPPSWELKPNDDPNSAAILTFYEEVISGKIRVVEVDEGIPVVISSALELVAQASNSSLRTIVEVRRVNHFVPESKIKKVCIALLSEAAGISFGRWNVEEKVNKLRKLIDEDPFAPLPL